MAAAAACWDALPDDIVRCIQARLPCPVDSVRMGGCCKAWRGATTADQPAMPRRFLPWLLLPLAGGPSLACVQSGGAACRSLDLPEDTRGARFFGSYDGQWLFLALRRTEGHVLLNLRTGERISLPDVEYGEVRAFRELPQPWVRGPLRPVRMLAVALSSAPTVSGECIAAAIINFHMQKGIHSRRRYVAFWRLGSRLAVCGNEVIDLVYMNGHGFSAQDIAYFAGRFFVLTKGEHLRAYTVLDEPNPIKGGDLHPDCEFYRTGRNKRWQDIEIVEHRAGYLVEPRGELLMVVKEWSAMAGDGSASSVQMFVLTPVEHDNPEMTRAWARVDDLDGRLLVVGPGCSRAYECAGFPGSCRGGVYFLDDRTYYNTSYYNYGTYFTLQRDDPDEFVWADNGRCDLRPTSRPENCFVRPPQDAGGFYSSYSPPVRVDSREQVLVEGATVFL